MGRLMRNQNGNNHINESVDDVIKIFKVHPSTRKFLKLWCLSTRAAETDQLETYIIWNENEIVVQRRREYCTDLLELMV